MLRTVALVLLVLWLLGFIGFGHAVGAFIHILIVAAVVLFLIDLLFCGRSIVASTGGYNPRAGRRKNSTCKMGRFQRRNHCKHQQGESMESLEKSMAARCQS